MCLDCILKAIDSFIYFLHYLPVYLLFRNFRRLYKKKNKVIIGITGKAGSGKTTAANYIASLCIDVDIISITDPVKEGSRVLFGLSEAELYDPEIGDKPSRWGMTPKAIFQWLETSVLKEKFGVDFLTRRLRERIEKSQARMIIVPNVRSISEAHMIHSIGGKILYIERTGDKNGPYSGMSSERGIAIGSIDKTIQNVNGNLYFLHSSLEWFTYTLLCNDKNIQ